MDGPQDIIEYHGDECRRALKELVKVTDEGAQQMLGRRLWQAMMDLDKARRRWPEQVANGAERMRLLE